MFALASPLIVRVAVFANCDGLVVLLGAFTVTWNTVVALLPFGSVTVRVISAASVVVPTLLTFTVRSVPLPLTVMYWFGITLCLLDTAVTTSLSALTSLLSTLKLLDEPDCPAVMVTSSGLVMVGSWRTDFTPTLMVFVTQMPLPSTFVPSFSTTVMVFVPNR